jgi:hypothetical protein
MQPVSHATGDIHCNVALLVHLLAGPITENIFYFPGLRRLDLSNNRFVGTLPNYAMQ